MRYVLFVCTHNAGRSQMAQAFFEPAIAFANPLCSALAGSGASSVR